MWQQTIEIMTETETIKVAIIEDRREIREGLGTLISFTDVAGSCAARNNFIS